MLKLHVLSKAEENTTISQLDSPDITLERLVVKV
jgi:hypothetical protein